MPADSTLPATVMTHGPGRGIKRFETKQWAKREHCGILHVVTTTVAPLQRCSADAQLEHYSATHPMPGTDPESGLQ